MRKFHYNSFFVAFFAYSVLNERMILIWQITVTQIYMFMVRKRSWQTSLKKLKRWTRKDERKPKTAFGCGWLGFIAEGAGIQTFELRSGVEKIQFDSKGQLFIKYISADGPQPAFWEALVRKFAPRSWSCYLAEESCTGLYITNDKLKRKITADYAIPGRCADGSYTSSLVRRSTFYSEGAMRELLVSKYGTGKAMAELLELAQKDNLPVYKVKRVD